MSTFQSRLRIATTLTAIVLSWFAISTFLAETFTSKLPRSWRDFTSQAEGNTAGPLTAWIANVAPLRGDLRVILTQRPDLRAAISEAYAAGSIDGKALTFELVNSHDPTFAATLR